MWQKEEQLPNTDGVKKRLILRHAYDSSKRETK